MFEFKPRTSLKAGDRGTCRPTGIEAMSYVLDKTHRFVIRNEKGEPWAYLYEGKKRSPVFDCNPQFFEKHFAITLTSQSIK